MLNLDFELLDAHPDWRHVLLAYSREFLPANAADSESSALLAKGFRPRVHEVGGLAAEQLTGIHGKLIAFGFLHVEIAGRTGGLLYQLSPEGRQACLRVADLSEEFADEALAVTVA